MKQGTVVVILLVLVLVVRSWRRRSRYGGYPDLVADLPVVPGAGPSEWEAWSGWEFVVPPTGGLGSQALSLQAGPDETVCTLSGYGERVANGRAVPYVAVRIFPDGRASLRHLLAGAYDLLIETGRDWDPDTRQFREPLARHRTERPLRLFGPDELALTAYPTDGGDLPLVDL